MRVDDQLSLNNRLSVRGSRWDWENPEVLAAGGHPSAASDQTKDATNVLGTWSRVMQGGNRILEIKGGYNGFHWTNAPQDSMMGTPEYRVPGPDVRRAVQLPADAEPEQLDRPRRLQHPQGEARPQDRRRVHPRPQRRPVVHPARRLLHVQQRADQPGDRAAAGPGIEPGARGTWRRSTRSRATTR